MSDSIAHYTPAQREEIENEALKVFTDTITECDLVDEFGDSGMEQPGSTSEDGKGFELMTYVYDDDSNVVATRVFKLKFVMELVSETPETGKSDDNSDDEE